MEKDEEEGAKKTEMMSTLMDGERKRQREEDMSHTSGEGQSLQGAGCGILARVHKRLIYWRHGERERGHGKG